MVKIIDIHTNILLGKSNIQNLRMQELLKRISNSQSKQMQFIKQKTIKINQKANFVSLIKSMKKNNITNSICFSYQWKKHSDCLKANNFIIHNLIENALFNIHCLVVVQPKSKIAKLC